MAVAAWFHPTTGGNEPPATAVVGVAGDYVLAHLLLVVGMGFLAVSCYPVSHKKDPTRSGQPQ
ncbi:hypothetical protein BRD00_14555 [Halobacteriales archaeon QS_8_69_26]|nr:MAG: hypothetical protein BRD00_14555 [Halobacteriales archaeon QS_8_69_26]